MIKGELFKTAMRVCGFTHQAFADAMGVSKSIVDNWASGRTVPPQDAVDRLRITLHHIKSGNTGKLPSHESRNVAEVIRILSYD